MPTVSENDSPSKKPAFNRGDIFIVIEQGKSGGERPSLDFMIRFIKMISQSIKSSNAPTRLKGSRPVIQWLQGLSGHHNSQFVHAGIIVSNDSLVEMSGQGIKLEKISEDLAGKTIVRFRCQDEEVAKLAADLAINLEKSLIKEQYPSLEANQEKIAYNYLDAAKALFTHPPTSKEEHAELYKNLLEMADTMEIPRKMFCSQFVVYVFALSHLLLMKSNAMSLPLTTNPSVLHDYLINHPGYEHEIIEVDKVLPTQINTDMTEQQKAFKEKVRVNQPTEESKISDPLKTQKQK